MFDKSDLDELPAAAQTAIGQAADRVIRSRNAGDVEGTIGASKELVETVAKVSISALGGSYGSNAATPKLANETLAALKLHPGGLQGRVSLQRLSQALISTINALVELRNSDGTGHGRAVPSSLHMSHATLASETAFAWSRWAISATARAVTENLPIDQVVSDIAGPLTLHRGQLPELLKTIRLDDLGEDEQRKLGLAVARRWSVNDTFMPREDVIEPMAAGEVEYPPSFAGGIIEGLLLDHDGYLRVKPMDLSLVVAIGRHLPEKPRAKVFDELAERANDALLSYVFDNEAQTASLSELRLLVEDEDDPLIRVSLTRFATRITELREGPPED